MAIELADRGESTILVRTETSPEDIAGIHSAAGILTQRGGMTSHAAVVARGMGKPCVVGCVKMDVFEEKKMIRFGEKTLKEGDHLSIDGSTGEVIMGLIPIAESVLIQQLRSGEGEQAEQFKLLINWAEEHATMEVRTNADTPEDAKLARLLGAKGVGLCRTEHMFFGEDRIQHIRKMIIAKEDRVRD